MAQLVPLRSVQLSLFSQTAKTSEEEVDMSDKRRSEQTEQGQTMAKKEYENGRRVKVKDPTGFNKSEESPLFSGPQPGDHLPPLKATGIRGKFADKEFDVIAEADGKPLVLFVQDDNGVGVRGLIGTSRALLDIANKSEKEIRTSVVFLDNDPGALSKWIKEFEAHVPKEVLLGISPDGGEGPGSYGLNRNAAMMILVAKGGKVIHNFAFQQRMLYLDPHVLGAMADVMGVEYETMSKWLDSGSKARGERRDMRGRRNRTSEQQTYIDELRKKVESGEMTCEEAGEQYRRKFPDSKSDDERRK